MSTVASSVGGKLLIFVPISKIDEAKRQVWGVMAEERTDRAREKFDYGRSKVKVQKWSDDVLAATKAIHGDNLDGLSLGNVRAMHGKVAAGKVIALNQVDEAKHVEIGTEVVDDNEWQKCLKGVNTGFSIAGSYAERWPDPDEPGVTRYVPELTEVSLVDRPCMYGATFTVLKADGVTELRKFVPSELEQVWTCGRSCEEGHHATKAEAAECLAKALGAELEKVKAREDVKPEEGKGKYGDVKFADEKNKKYPIDTEAHIRSAWNYINKPKNAGKYSAEDAKSIKARIVSAWKAKIDKDGPPSAEKLGVSDFDKIHKPSIKHEGNEYKVVDSDGHVYGTHDNEADAKKQLAALYAAKDREEKAMTPEMQKAVGERFVKLADERKVEIPEEVRKESLGALDWLGSLKTRQAARALYILALLEELVTSEAFEGEEHEGGYPDQVAALEGAKEQVEAFITSELAEEDEPGGSGAGASVVGMAPMAMAEVAGELMKVTAGQVFVEWAAGEAPEPVLAAWAVTDGKWEPIEKSLSDRIKAHITKANAQEVHDHTVKEHAAKCSKEAAAEADGVEKVEPVTPIVPVVPVVVEPTKAEEPELVKVLADINGQLEKIKTEREAERKASEERESALQKQVETLKASTDRISKRIVEKDGEAVIAKKGGEPVEGTEKAEGADPGSLMKAAVDELKKQFGDSLTPEMIQKLGEKVAERVYAASKQ